MQSVTSNAVAKNLSYSSTEFKTGGKWIDGKPIYRKVYDVTTPSSNNVIVNVADTPSNFQEIISLQGLIYGDYNNAYIYYPINHFITTEDYSSCWIRATNQKIAMKVYGTSKLNKPAKIIIEYTKTTD